MGSPRLDKLDKNVLINGDFRYWQRGTALATTTNALRADRWYIGGHTSSVGTINRNNIAPSSLNSVNYCAEAHLTTTTSSANSESVYFGQRIENIFAQNLAGKKASLTFWVKTSDFTDVKIIARNCDTDGDYLSETEFYSSTETLEKTGDWEKISITLDCPTLVANGMTLYIRAINGDSLSGVSYFALTAVKLSEGEQQQEFSLAGRNHVEEYQLCQRYYEILDYRQYLPNIGTTVHSLKVAANHSFAVEKRAVPAITRGIDWNCTSSSHSPSTKAVRLEATATSTTSNAMILEGTIINAEL